MTRPRSRKLTVVPLPSASRISETDRMGVMFSPELLARMLSVRWGIPLPDGLKKDRPGRGKEKGAEFHPRLLSQFNPYEKNLVAHCTTNGQRCGPAELGEFIGMHPGVRELRMRNFISREWSGPDWRTNISAFGEAKRRLYAVCSLKEPTEAEKLQAISKPDELSDLQRSFAAEACGIDPKTPAPSHISEFGKQLSALKPGGLVEYWRKNRMDFMAMADIIHKVRFANTPLFTAGESKLLAMICDVMAGPGPSAAQVPPPGLREAFDSIVYPMVRNGNYLGINLYQPLIFAAWLLNDRLRLGYRSLADSARAESEFSTLAEFLGFGILKAEGQLDYSFCVTKEGLDENGNPKVNEDSSSGAVVTLHDGRRIRLDAVWDGMGGHEGGQVASGIAKEVFELAAVAGWIRTPEDVRRVLVMADLAIVFEQISNKYDINDQTVRDPSNLAIHPQANKMGTTAAVSFQCGEYLYVIHAGDSEFGLYDGGPESSYLHINHDIYYSTELQVEREAARFDLERQLRIQGMGADPIKLSDAAWHRAEEEMRARAAARDVTHAISSALGANSRYIQINGFTQGYPSIRVRKDAVFLLCSDGISDVICQHERADIIRKADGDLALARRMIMDLAISRSDDSKIFKAACGCEREGKNDDKTLSLRFAGEGV